MRVDRNIGTQNLKMVKATDSVLVQILQAALLYDSNSGLLELVVVVDLDLEGNLYVNGNKVNEKYLKNKAFGSVSIDFPYTVPKNHIFILSDDRLSQSDSRNILIGSIDIDDIYGKALLKVYPINEIGIVNAKNRGYVLFNSLNDEWDNIFFIKV